MVVFGSTWKNLQNSKNRRFEHEKMEPTAGIEPVTYGLQNKSPLEVSTNLRAFTLKTAPKTPLQDGLDGCKRYKQLNNGSIVVVFSSRALLSGGAA